MKIQSIAKLTGLLLSGFFLIFSATAQQPSQAPATPPQQGTQTPPPTAQTVQYPFQDPALSIGERVNDLVARLTLEEKVAQMLNAAPAIDRLGIPSYNWWNECLHGVARTPFKVTVYPQAIGMAATFDTGSLHRMADYTAEEGRAINNESIRNGRRNIYLGLTYWTPNINIFRDPRWGRGQETYGEDPYLTGTMGKAFVTGLQGDDPVYLKAAACAKHYAVHSGPESTRHEFNAEISDYDLWDTYLPAFHKLVVDAKVAGVMCAYNALRGQPCCGNDLLMNSILRNDWHFSGYVTSDCGAIDDFYQHHKTHSDAESAAADAVLHGTDVECGRVTYQSLASAVKDGKLTEQQLDISVKRLFTIRFRLGMFDPPEMVKYARIPVSVLESPEHQAQALEMARQSIVLLRNQDHVLPLSKNLKKIAVLGPNADNAISILGNYNGRPSQTITALQGIKEKLGVGKVIYAPGTDYTAPDTTTSVDAIIDKVKDADAIIFVGGISPQLEGEEMRVSKPGFSGGDRTSIALPDVQTQFLKKLAATGKPVVLVMMTGSALAIPWEAEHIPAILNAWYGGQAAGTAIADVLFGDYNPAGRLPVTFYRSDKDLPAFDDYSMNNRTYRYFKGKPLYGFGYGLSYSSFAYDQLTIPATVSTGNGAMVSVRVTNASARDGEEVTELYLSHLKTKGRAPIRALKGFTRTYLKAGESKTLSFNLRPEDLSLTGEDGHSSEETGQLLISVGGSQPDAETMKSKKTVEGEMRIVAAGNAGNGGTEKTGADGNGAFATGKYPNLFAGNGHSETEISAKIDAAWRQLFHGDTATQAVYFEAGKNANGPLAYVSDVPHHDIRTEGMSYAMMIAVQLNKKAEFDAVWNYAMSYMYLSNPDHPAEGYFSWSLKRDGTPNEETPAPDGEEYFVMALYFASARWGNGEGIYNYREWADKILTTMRHHPLRSGMTKFGKRTIATMVNEDHKMIRFVPGVERGGFTDPSYHLPAFYELWARWGPETDRSFWAAAADTSRDFFQRATDPQTGLAPDYAQFDGTPFGGGWGRRQPHFGFDSWRTASNWSVDWAWWQKDKGERVLSDRIQAFFAGKGMDTYADQYTLSGDPLEPRHANGLIATNAVASLAATDARRREFVEALWKAPIPQELVERYYDGLLYVMSLLHCSGRYRIWGPPTPPARS